MRRRLLHRNDRADSNVIGTVLMIGVVVAAVPGIMVIQKSIHESYDYGSDVAEDARIAALARSTQHAAGIQEAQNRTSSFGSQAANAKAAADQAAANATSLQAQGAALQAQLATTDLAIKCANLYVMGREPAPDCPPELKPYEAYPDWYETRWTCSICLLPNTKTYDKEG